MVAAIFDIDVAIQFKKGSFLTPIATHQNGYNMHKQMDGWTDGPTNRGYFQFPRFCSATGDNRQQLSSQLPLEYEALHPFLRLSLYFKLRKLISAS